jgi:hypothetical protein
MDHSYSIIEFENGKSYLVVDEVTLNEKKYLFLANEKNNKDLLFQNINYESDTPKLNKIESEEEFNKVSTYFMQRYKRIYG